MKARFIHTADWQLGKPFAGVEDDEKRALLRNKRFSGLGDSRLESLQLCSAMNRFFDCQEPADHRNV